MKLSKLSFGLLQSTSGANWARTLTAYTQTSLPSGASRLSNNPMKS